MPNDALDWDALKNPHHVDGLTMSSTTIIDRRKKRVVRSI